MIYFIHDVTSRTIKIGCARDPRRRLSTLQISTSNKLVMIGMIGGTERTEKKVHDLVCKHCAPKPGETFARPVRVGGEWFDDRILPFVMELIASPKRFLDADKKPSPVRPVSNDPSIRQCKMIFAFDSGEQYQENYLLRAASPEAALQALTNIAHARLPFLANTVQITALTAPGCPTRRVELRGAFVTQKCRPTEGVSVIFNSAPDGCYATIGGIRQFSSRWLHGVPDELGLETHWRVRPTDQFDSFLAQFAHALTSNQCVISSQNPLIVRGVFARGIGELPKGELRSKVNKAAAVKRKPQRPPGQAPRVLDGIVYFIQDTATLALKIGFCLRKPEKRLAALQTGNSNALRLLGHVVGSSHHERLLHKRFVDFHVQGEWFSSAIIGEIEGLIKCAVLEEWLKAQVPVQEAALIPTGHPDSAAESSA